MKNCTLIVSDIHIGSPVSRAEALLALLRDAFGPLKDANGPLVDAPYSRLIILGDLFNDLLFTRLTREDWKLLSYLRKLSNPKNGLEVLWVRGNHDEPSCEVVAHLLGIRLVDDYEWEVNDQRYLAIHGHQFDHFIEKNPLITSIACGVYFFFQLLDKKTHRFSRFIKRTSKRWLGLSEKLAVKALIHGKLKQCHIICGHTHQAMSIRGPLSYFNSGCWTDIPSTFLTVDNGGVVFHSVDDKGKCSIVEM